MKYEMSLKEYGDFESDIANYNRELTGMPDYETGPPKMFPDIYYDAIRDNGILDIRKSRGLGHEVIYKLTDPIEIKEWR